MGKRELGRDSRRDRDRPIDSGRDDPVHLLGFRQPIERRLILSGDERPSIGEREPDRTGIAIRGDNEQPALARGLEQTKLRRPSPEHEESPHANSRIVTHRTPFCRFGLTARAGSLSD